MLKHGLAGEHRFGKSGAYAYVRQTGCIQYDPIDVCGKNSELVFQSRVKGFTKNTLDELLYKDRLLIDYPDKNLSIIPAEDWPCFERYRAAARENAARCPGMPDLIERARAFIEKNGVVCSDDLKFEGDFRWFSAIHWSAGNNPSRSALEAMYSTGDLIVHHKKGPRKYYDLTGKYLPTELLAAPEPFPDEFDHQKWRVLRRIGAVGLIWNRPSDAWLNIWGLDSAIRVRIFAELLNENKIIPVAVDGIKDPLYCRAEDGPLVETVSEDMEYKPRCELIAPLDCFIWDRKLIKRLFGFEYAWEIYYPAPQRKYGYYVLPLLYGDGFIGRVEAVADKKTQTLNIKNIWYEDGVKRTKKLQSAVEKCLGRFAGFNGCDKTVYL